MGCTKGVVVTARTGIAFSVAYPVVPPTWSIESGGVLKVTLTIQRSDAVCNTTPQLICILCSASHLFNIGAESTLSRAQGADRHCCTITALSFPHNGTGATFWANLDLPS